MMWIVSWGFDSRKGLSASASIAVSDVSMMLLELAMLNCHGNILLSAVSVSYVNSHSGAYT